MKKLFISILLVIMSCCFFVACGGDDPGNDETTLLTFENIVFNNQTIDYDGDEHSIVATGVPQGASVVYTNAGPFVDAGEYNIGVKISKENYIIVMFVIVVFVC